MTDAPERIWMDPDIRFPECEKQYGCGVEYIRADLVDAIIAATFDLAEGKCAETLTMFENENPNRPDVMPYIDDACEACGDAIRALNTPETAPRYWRQ